jgi:hypothetical protein
MKDGKPSSEPTLSAQLIDFIDWAILASPLKKGTA